MKYILKNDKLTTIVDSLGAEVKSVKGSDGFEYMWQGMENYWSDTASVLFPICGRLLNSKYSYNGKEYSMSGHGFALKSDFEVVEVADSYILLSLKSNESTYKNYPFDFELQVKYELVCNKLLAEFKVTNLSRIVMPYMIGWHPGFTLENDGNSEISDFCLDYGKTTKVQWYPIVNGWLLSSPVEYTFDSPVVPLNEELIYKYDTLIYKGTENKVKLFSEKEKHSVTMKWSDNLPYLCIWKEPTADTRFICLEPWSSIPSDGTKPECFDDRKMDRLASGSSAIYSYNVLFN